MKQAFSQELCGGQKIVHVRKGKLFCLSVLLCTLGIVTFSCDKKSTDTSARASLSSSDAALSSPLGSLESLMQGVPNDAFGFSAYNFEHAGMKAWNDSAWKKIIDTLLESQKHLVEELTKNNMQGIASSVSADAAAAGSAQTSPEKTSPTQNSSLSPESIAQQDVFLKLNELYSGNKGLPQDVISFVAPLTSAQVSSTITRKDNTQNDKQIAADALPVLPLRYCSRLRFKEATPSIHEFTKSLQGALESLRKEDAWKDSLTFTAHTTSSSTHADFEIGILAKELGFHIPLRVLSDDKQLALCNSVEEAKAFLEGKTSPEAFSPSTLPGFQETASQLPWKSDPMMVKFLNIKNLSAHVQQSLSGNAELLKFLSELPIQSVVAQSVYENNKMLSLAGLLKASVPADDLTPLLFTNNSLQPFRLLASLPDNSPLALGVDTRFVKELLLAASKTVADNGASAAQALPLEELKKDVLADIENIRVSIGTLSPGALFPNVSLAVQAKDPAQIVERLKSLFGQGAGAALGAGQAGGVEMTWSKKEIQGVQAEYVLAPLGFGVYLAQSKVQESPSPVLFISTSEPGLASLLQDAAQDKESKKDLFHKLNPDNASLSSAGEVFALHLDLLNLAQLADQVHASTAMFTGGQPMPAEAQKYLTLMRDAGSVQLSVRSGEKALYLESAHDLSPAKGAK